MSRTKAFSFIAGAARLIGFVPRIAVRPNVGTTKALAFVMLTPIRLCSRAISV
jgi:hypothetical protein